MIGSLGEYLKKVMLMFDENVFRFVFKIKKIKRNSSSCWVEASFILEVRQHCSLRLQEESSTRDLISSLRF